MSRTLIAVVIVIVRVTLNWADTNSTEDGTNIYREIAGAYQQVGQVGPNATQFSETFSASEGAQLPYKIKAFRGEELSPYSNEWVGTVPTAPEPPPPCRQKGKSNNCR